MTGEPTAAADVQVDLQKVASVLTTARRLLAGGTMIDLSALQGMVRGVCDQVAALPLEQARAMRPGLESLLSGLDRLGDDLQALHARLNGGDNAGAPR